MCSNSAIEENVPLKGKTEQIGQTDKSPPSSVKRGSIHAEETLKCKKCGKVFRGKEELEVHKRITHRSKNEQNKEIGYLWQNISGW